MMIEAVDSVQNGAGQRRVARPGRASFSEHRSHQQVAPCRGLVMARN